MEKFQKQELFPFLSGYASLPKTKVSIIVHFEACPRQALWENARLFIERFVDENRRFTSRQ